MNLLGLWVGYLTKVIGIPHGAVDHLIAIPELISFKMASFLIKYLFAPGLAIWFMLQVYAEFMV